MVSIAIRDLVEYALERSLIHPEDRAWAINRLLEALELDSFQEPLQPPPSPLPGLEELLRPLLDDACDRGVIEEGVVSRDLLDTRLMGCLTPSPAEVRRRFAALYAQSPRAATDWYYALALDSDYIRRYRIKKDLRWKTPTPYGELDITINLSKPEKDPKAIAAARSAPQSDYPKCLLCRENEGYAGRVNHPARQNLRLIPLTMDGRPWRFQYSPYVYYNEHCIALSDFHQPMKIEPATFRKMLDFLRTFPHYFIGSNADLPIVGGSILSHDHFQGGRYEFAMEKAPLESSWGFEGFEEVEAGVVRWPMSVLRLRCADGAPLIALASAVLAAWRGYTDEAAMVHAHTGDIPHNTITPIARMRGGEFELDLVLRNNLTTEEYPLGLYHPHPELHHIKKENIGLIEVMGLAVLPARLREELALLESALLEGRDPKKEEAIAKHAAWAGELAARHPGLCAQNASEILRQEVGLVFLRVLEDAGVFKCHREGRAAFGRFLAACGGRERS